MLYVNHALKCMECAGAAPVNGVLQLYGISVFMFCLLTCRHCCSCAYNCMSHVLRKQCCNEQILVQSNSVVCLDSKLPGHRSHLKLSATGRCEGKVDFETLG